MPFNVPPPLRQGGSAVGLEAIGRCESGVDGGRLHGREQGLADRLVDLHAADIEAVDASTLDDVLAGAMVAGRGVGAAIVGAQPPAAMATGGDALEQRRPLSHGSTRLVRSRSNIGRDTHLVRFIGRPLDEALMMVGNEHRPLGARQPTNPFAHGALVVDIALMTALPIGIGAGIDGIGQDMVDRGVGRAAPTDLTRWGHLRGKGEVLAAQPQPHPTSRAQFGEPLEHEADRTGHGGVGMKADLAIGIAPNQAHRQGAAQLATGRLVADPALEAGTQNMQLSFGHGAFEPQYQTIVEPARVIDAVGIADQGIGHATEIEQAVPVGVVAGQAGDLEAEHDADPAQGHLGGHAGEAVAVGGASAGDAEIVVNHSDLLACPAQPARLLDQSVLPVGRFPMACNLGHGGLTHVDQGGAAPMPGHDLGRFTHRLAPGERWPAPP